MIRPIHWKWFYKSFGAVYTYSTWLWTKGTRRLHIKKNLFEHHSHVDMLNLKRSAWTKSTTLIQQHHVTSPRYSNKHGVFCCCWWSPGSGAVWMLNGRLKYSKLLFPPTETLNGWKALRCVGVWNFPRKQNSWTNPRRAPWTITSFPNSHSVFPTPWRGRHKPASKGCKRAQSGYREHRYLKHLPLTAVQGSSVLARAKKENGKSSMTGLSGTKPRNSRVEKTKVIFSFQDDTFEDFRRRWSREGNEDNDLL